jgi:PAS domain S-box-containing protein
MVLEAQNAAVDGDIARFFFENSLDLLAVVSAEGRFLASNDAWRLTTGWSTAQLTGRSFIDFVHPDCRERVRADGLSSLAGAETVTDFRFRTAVGGWIWLRSRGRVTPSGRLTVSAHDVTEERSAERERQEVRRSRELLREAAGAGAWTFHPARGFSWSPELAALSPHLTELETLESFQAHVHPDDLQMLTDVMRRGVRDGGSAIYEIRFRGPDGGWRHFRNHMQARRLSSGLHELYGFSQEVSDLAHARDHARAGEQRARGLIEAAPFAVALFDRDLRYEVVSPLWASMLDVGPEEIGRSLAERPRAPAIFIEHVRRALAGVVTPPTNHETQDVSGAPRTYRWTTRPYRDDSGEVVAAIAYLDDITAFESARRDAETNARRLEMALAAGGAGVIEIDYRRGEVWSSTEFDRIVGRKMSFGDVTRKRWPILGADDRASLEAIGAWWSLGAEGPLELQVTHPDGARRWVRVYFDVERGPDRRIVRMSGLAQDIDSAKRQELALIEAERQAQAAAEAKARFLANMSHEIRTPMNGVLGVLHLLRDEPLSEEGRELLDEAGACGRMLAELLNDVIDFSRIEEGRLELSPEPADAAHLVRGAVRLLQPQADSKGLSLRVEAPEQLWVRVDPVRLRQALFNLVGNAVKFTSAGHVHVRLSAPAAGRLRIEVEDSGPGISEADQSKLFVRFQQVDGSSTRRFGGSGLGLAITRALAELMGGEVSVRSRLGCGSCFAIEIEAPVAAPPRIADASTAPAFAGLRVLLVEDNATNRLVLGRMLEALGAAVSMASDGREGVDAARTGGFDLILMDVQMPVMDGLQAVAAIRAAGGDLAATPVIALTADALSHQAERYRAAGMDEVVSKPVSPAALVAAVARLSVRGALDEAA